MRRTPCRHWAPFPSWNGEVVGTPVASAVPREGAALRAKIIRLIQELLGQSSVSTAAIDTHVLNRRLQGVLSPLDGGPSAQVVQRAAVARPGPRG